MIGTADQSRWNEALYGRNDRLLHKLVGEQSAEACLTQMAGYVNGLYEMRRLNSWREGNPQIDVARVTPVIAEVRSGLSAREQRQIDLRFLRFVRRSGCLSAVIGAGASKSAGGPLWGELVEDLLRFALSKLSRDEQGAARRLLERIKNHTANTEDLMRGAQLCVDRFGQRLFTHMHRSLYGPAREPGPVYDAIASLAAPLERGPNSPFGWWRIINYNFDNLIGEALDARAIPRISYLMWGNRVKCASQTLRDEFSRHVPILHLHGYTPRTLLPITGAQFVFSTSQYAEVYHGPRVGIMQRAFEECLARPMQLALYVGCSFNDDSMNKLLRDASRTLPGRRHFALLPWPGNGDPLTATAAERTLYEVRYHGMGVQPIWFRDFSEIPTLLRSLA